MGSSRSPSRHHSSQGETHLHVLTTVSTLPSLAGLPAHHQATSFCSSWQMVVPGEAAPRSATLATSSFLSLLSVSWAQTSSGDSQRRTPAAEMHGVRPLEVWRQLAQPLSLADALQRRRRKQLSRQERPSRPPPVPLPGTFVHQKARSQVLSLGSHLCSTRCSHLTHLPSAKVPVLISKPAFRPNRTCF